jgi:ionotropic glutamate receptor
MKNNKFLLHAINHNSVSFHSTGLFKLQDLVKSPPSPKTEIYIRQAGPGSYRQVLKEIRQKEIYKLIIDTDPIYMQQFFRAVSL